MAASRVLQVDQARVDDRSPITPGAMDRIAELRAIVAELETAMHTQRRIGALIGIFAARYGCGTDRAWEMVAELSQQTGITVRDLTRMLLAVFDGGAVDAADHDLLAVLAERLPDGRWITDSRDGTGS